MQALGVDPWPMVTVTKPTTGLNACLIRPKWTDNNSVWPSFTSLPFAWWKSSLFWICTGMVVVKIRLRNLYWLRVISICPAESQFEIILVIACIMHWIWFCSSFAPCLVQNLNESWDLIWSLLVLGLFSSSRHFISTMSFEFQNMRSFQCAQNTENLSPYFFRCKYIAFYCAWEIKTAKWNSCFAETRHFCGTTNHHRKQNCVEHFPQKVLTWTDDHVFRHQICWVCLSNLEGQLYWSNSIIQPLFRISRK